MSGMQVANDIRDQGYAARFIQTDVTDSVSVRKMVCKTVLTFGELNIPVNNAAMHPDSQQIADLNEDGWARTVATNLTSAALCLKSELQQMVKQEKGGSIINISSSVAAKAMPRLPAYTMAKKWSRGADNYRGLGE